MLSIIQAAGWPIWPLVICSILGVALIIERFISLQRARIAPKNLLDEALTATREKLPAPDTLQHLEDSSLYGQVLATGIRAINADPNLNESDLRSAMEGAGRRAAHSMERFLPALATIASAAPLMGLFGTVVGMIEIFASYTPAGGDPAQLARGISVALYNTGFGIFIAIPSLIFWRHFRALVDSFVVDMEQQAVRLVEIMHGERKAA